MKSTKLKGAPKELLRSALVALFKNLEPEKSKREHQYSKKEHLRITKGALKEHQGSM